MKKSTLWCVMTLGLCLSGVSHAQISTEQAHRQLTAAAKQKVLDGSIHLEALLKNNSNDLIVEYVTDTPRLTVRTFAIKLQNVNNRFESVLVVAVGWSYYVNTMVFH